MIEKKCLTCGKIFLVKPYNTKAKFCSRACHYESRTYSRIKRICKICGKIDFIIPSNFNSKFCSCTCWEVGMKGSGNPFYGEKHTKKSLRIMRETHLGVSFSKEHRNKIGLGNKGKKLTEEHKKRISEGNKGKTISEEVRNKISKSLKGHVPTEETRKKLGEASRNRECTEETRRKISKANKGKVRSKETRRKISEANRNRKYPKRKIESKICAECGKEFQRPYGKGIRGWNETKFCSHSCYSKNIKGKKGHQCFAETKEKISRANSGEGNGMYGKKPWNWNGEITKFAEQIRNHFKYRAWRKSVLKRDYWTCQECKIKEGNRIEAHHEKEFAVILEENNIKTIENAENCEELWDIKNGKTLCKECHKKYHKEKRLKQKQLILFLNILEQKKLQTT